MSQDHDEYDVTDSDQDVEGHIGVSSERVGHAGPGQEAPTGVRDTREIELDRDDDDLPPEQSAGGEEVKPEGLEPKAGYPSPDPRSQD